MTFETTPPADQTLTTPETDLAPHAAPVAALAPVSSDVPAKPDAAATPSAKAPLLPAFAALGIMPELLMALQSLGYEQPTPVQSACLQALNAAQAQDLMVSSQTGSGKTAAFLLPVISQLWHSLQAAKKAEAAAWQAQCEAAIAAGLPPPAKPKRKNPKFEAQQGRGRRGQFSQPAPRALVLCPTRELAQQVSKQAIALVQHLPGLRVATVTGGASYSVQLAALQNVQLLVATPGRLLDLHNSGSVSLSQVQALVLDEADRMLDLGFAPDVQTISEACEQRSHTLMFSATFGGDIEGLAASLMDQPQRLTLHNAKEAHRDIAQVLHWADDGQHQMALLDHYLRAAELEQAIVFARTQIECEELSQALQEAGHSACALHGAQSQGLRNRHMMLVRGGKVRVLVATDVAARGIDVPNISHVFNFGLPQSSEDYTHRIGRTGRAGRSGLAISLVRLGEQRRLGMVFHSISRALKVQTIQGLEPSRSPEVQAPSGKGFGGARRSGGGYGGGRSHSAGRSSFGDRPSYGDRPAFGDRPAYGEKRSFGDRPAFSDRPAYGAKRSHGDRPAFGDKRGFADKPAGKFGAYDRTPSPAKAATHAIFHDYKQPHAHPGSARFGAESGAAAKPDAAKNHSFKKQGAKHGKDFGAPGFKHKPQHAGRKPSFSAR